ncbi:ATP-binding cassette domain-containing protein [Streptomyces pristinaespiralis]|uniref:ABC transporter permease n=1 Tax=Streptomyces pristinaespiralis TaxID=38300 RepID=A0A0M4DA94_STRPR|nr:ATP-binding cassette domain-containing protein [Streptomyces pristinaespiralis]ALC24078.1 ABC transporter permease [Streptomyces pristinaespiralis]QMU13530.1 ATP-binding cassette domain-containing protein [Streptomyces pristinaespiralis]
MASLTYDLTLAGLAVGSAAALTGIGLIVTYRATGVLNLAHGAIAMVCAYVMRQFAVEWEWPVPLAAVVTLLVVAPGIGLLLERLVFRPLSVPWPDPARTLVASIGVFVLLVGAAALLWGEGARADAPVLLPDSPWAQLSAVVLLASLVTAVTRWTRFGKQLRAVVDNRALAALGGIDADRVAAAGWAFGSFTAGLTGVLLAPYVRLDPYGLPLLVVEVIAVAVVARMRSLPVAIGAALAIGVAQAQMARLHLSGWAEPLVQAVEANLFVVALLIAALVLPGFGGATAWAAAAAVKVPRPVWLVAGVLLLLPLGFAGTDLQTAIRVPALAVVLLSLVVITGRGGQISLGQAAYAGLGALFTVLLASGRFPGFPELPELVALAAAVVLVAPLGLLTGWPAIRRRGPALALVTLAVGVAVSRFVLAQPYATAGLVVSRPPGLGSDRAYYVVELAVLTCALLAVAALRRGRTGRALAALRDHEEGAQAAGVAVPALKLFAFSSGAALAALGGGLLAMGVRAFDPAAFDPVRGLLWFAAVFVLGADNLLAPLPAAALLVALDAGTRGGVAAVVIGLLAVLVGHGRLRLGAAGPAAGRPRAGRVVARAGALTGAARARSGGPAPPARRARRPAAGGLSAEGLRVAYQGRVVVDGVDLFVAPGRITALVGGNGAGKSTLFHCLCGSLRPEAGRVRLGGVDISRRSPHARTRLGIARTFQQLAVFPSLTVEENVRVGAEQGRHRDTSAVEPVLRLLGLDGPVRRLPAAGLPTGVLRRAELGRALATRPHTLLLDEPTAGLDTAETETLARVLRALAADGTAVLVVEHDLGFLTGLAGTVHVMEAGRLVR